MTIIKAARFLKGRPIAFFALLLTLLMITGCGGGGGGGNDSGALATEQPTEDPATWGQTNWDEMQWQ